MYKKNIKPLFDRVGATILFVVLFPLLLLIAITLALFQRGNIFFIQERPGLQGKRFKLIKFTSMLGPTDKKSITPLGRLLRKTSLDELPQLVNVIKGEMSLIGPRPLLAEYVDLYSAEQYRRHDVLPGITGLAQVNGRTTISWKEKFTMDTYYVEHCSFKLDCQIIVKTIGLLFELKEQPPEQKFNGTN